MTNKGSIEIRDGCLDMIVECNKIKKSISLLKINYITKILTRFNMHNCKPISTPIKVGLRLIKDISLIDSKDIEKWKMFYIQLLHGA